MTTRNVSLALRNIKQNNFTDFNYSGPLQDNLNVQLNNGAQCNFDGNNLECAFHAKSHNPFQQQVDDPSKDYRFTDEIKIENLALKSIETSVKCSEEDMEELETECEYGISSSCAELEKCSGKIIRFEGGENTKVNYIAEYPTYSGVTGSINADNEGGRSTVRIEGFSGETNEGFQFSDSEKGGTQSVIKVEEDFFSVHNKGLDNLSSKLHIESVDQTSKEIGTKNARFDYEDTYQIMYYTEPDAVQHDLEINII